MNIEIIPAAEEEFRQAVKHYNKLSSGLGFEFAAEVKNTFDRISTFPNAWTNLSCRAKRCLCNRFPFGVIYQIRQDQILIISIMHLHKHPDTWMNRMNE